jgi:hypothetical protein
MRRDWTVDHGAPHVNRREPLLHTFPGSTLPGEGEWPYPHHSQIELLPKDVVALGWTEETMLNEDRLYFPYEAEVEIRKRLRAHGYKVVKNNRLVRAACDDGTDYKYFKSH